jgi:hypothetical protein
MLDRCGESPHDAAEVGDVTIVQAACEGLSEQRVVTRASGLDERATAWRDRRERSAGVVRDRAG